MTNRFGIYLCRGSCRRKEFVGRAIGSVVAIAAGCVLPDVTGAARIEGDYELFLGAAAV
jgi:hypothetical protein